MTRIFNVDSSNKYLVLVEEIKQIEDAGDSFMTEEELGEMLKVPEEQRRYHFWSGRTFREDLMRKQLTMWIGKINDGAKSIVITDTDLIDALKESYQPISHYVKGARRIDNRLFYTTPVVKTVPTKRDHQNLINVIQFSINLMYKFHIDIKFAANDREGSLKVAKQMIGSWDNIMWKKVSNYNEVEQLRMKQIWDNPAIFN